MPALRRPRVKREKTASFICPVCGAHGVKVLYMGIPMKFCMDESCALVWGFWSGLMRHLPFNGMFFIYEGNYFEALYWWLRGEE
jgi:hypothetical protein